MQKIDVYKRQTYEWYSRNYLDRDYPLRFILRCNGVAFPDTPEEEK